MANEVKVKITGDATDAEQALDDFKNEAEEAETPLQKLAAIGKVAGQAIVAGFAAASAAAVALGRAALENYAEYEQLAGGAQLMYGDAYDYVAEKAANAYATVQLSQNEYLQQVNGFAVGLREALGGNSQAAAELADKIVTAEADIVAATGVTQENIQNAFNGIMRGNYTMLDNLQLGIKPTKEGMQELIDQVNAWNAAQGHATNYTIDNVADVQSALVDYVGMIGMSGYAATEAAHTIQGSTAAMRASWSNLLTGIADENADLDALLSAFAESASNWLDNIVGRIEVMIPRIIEAIPAALPQLVEIAIRIGTSIIDGLVRFVPAFLRMGANLLRSLANGIINQGPRLVADFLNWVSRMIDTLPQMIPQLVSAAVEFFSSIGPASQTAFQQSMSGIGNMLVYIVNQILSFAPSLGTAAAELFGNIYLAILDVYPQILEGFYSIVLGLINLVIENAPAFLEAVWGFITNFLTGIIEQAPAIIEGLLTMVSQLISLVFEYAPEFLSAALSFVGQMVSAIITKAPEILAELLSAVQRAIDGIFQIDFAQVGEDIINGIVAGLRALGGLIGDVLLGFVSDAWGGIKSFLGISSPSKLMRDTVGRMIPLGIVEGIDDESAAVDASIDRMLELDVTPSITGSFASLASAPSYSISLRDLVVNDDAQMREVTEAFIVELARRADSYCG